MKNNLPYSTITKSLWLNSAIITKQIDNSMSMHGIGFNEYMVLNSLVNAPQQKLRRIDLADTIGRTASGITRMLMPMEKIGLITKESNPRDARVSMVKITPAGERIYQETSETLQQRSAQLLKHLDEAQLIQLQQLLITLNES